MSVGLAGAVVVAGLATLSTSAAADDHPIRGAGSRSAIPGSYIVMLKDSASLRGKGLAPRAAGLAGSHHGTLGDAWAALHGFSVHMSAADAKRLAAEPDVEFVQQDQMRAGAGFKKVGGSPAGPRATAALAKPGQVTASVALADNQISSNAAQTPVTWALDRIDQHALPLDNHYAYDDTAGQGVTAYILSTGINIAHPDFGGRAFYGPNFADDGRTNSDDCHGSGTAFAGLIGGTQYGVAKKVKLVGVRMANCQNIFTDTAIMNSVNWVVANGVRPAVVHLGIDDRCFDVDTGSLVDCPPSNAQLLINAQESLFNAGYPVVGSAGDYGQDTCSKSSGAAPDAVYVGATDSNDSLALFSDYGPCVTMFAPGASVTTDGLSGTVTVSSTAYSAALVTGTAALFLGKPEFANAAPGTIRDELVKNRSTSGVISNLTLNSPNRLLFTGPPGFFTIDDSLGASSSGGGGGGGGQAQIVGPTPSGNLARRVLNADGSWGPWAVSATRGWQTAAIGVNANGSTVLAGVTPFEFFNTAKKGKLFQRSETAAGSNVWFNWKDYDGAGITSVALARNQDGRLVRFATDAAGQVLYYIQASSNSPSWESGHSFTDSLVQSGRSLTAAVNVNDRIALFGIRGSGQVWQRVQNTAGDPSSWSPLANIGDFGVVAISVTRQDDGRLVMLGVDAGGNPWQRRQTSAGATTWTNWGAMPAKTLSTSAAVTDANGLVHVVGVDNLGNLWQTQQTAKNATTFNPWTQLDGQLRP